MINLKQAITDNISAALNQARENNLLPGLKAAPEITISVPELEEHGDYASPVALSIASQTKMNPMEIVGIIAEQMDKDEYIGRIKAAKPGYLNIWLNPGWMTSRLDNLIQEEICADIDIGEGKSANLEFISANPTGPLTIGNTRSAFTADTLANILECAGYDVTKEYYFNDSGAQVKKLGESVILRHLQQKGIEVDYREELYQGDYIKEISDQVAETLLENENKEITEKDVADPKTIQQAGDMAASLLMTQIKKTIKDTLRIEFDTWTSEDELREKGKVKNTINRLQDSNLVYEKDNAFFLKTTAYGDNQDRVLIKSDGEYAYVAPDIAYHQDKYDRGFDEIFTFVGADHQGHLPKIRAAMEALGNNTAQLHPVVNQWMRIIKDGKPYKVSKRAGQIVTPEDLIDEVGYDAARFLMVQNQLNNHMEFDINLAKEKSEKNPVYYTQYAYVRLQSILRQAKQRGIIENIGMSFNLSDSPSLTHSMELALMRQLYRLPEIIGDIALDFEVHKITYYATDLAKAIHVFYRHVPVLVGENKQEIESRLQLVLAAREVMGKTLDLIGISKPEVM